MSFLDKVWNGVKKVGGAVVNTVKGAVQTAGAVVGYGSLWGKKNGKGYLTNIFDNAAKTVTSATQAFFAPVTFLAGYSGGGFERGYDKVTKVVGKVGAAAGMAIGTVYGGGALLGALGVGAGGSAALSSVAGILGGAAGAAGAVPGVLGSVGSTVGSTALNVLPSGLPMVKNLLGGEKQPQIIEEGVLPMGDFNFVNSNGAPLTTEIQPTTVATTTPVVPTEIISPYGQQSNLATRNFGSSALWG